MAAQLVAEINQTYQHEVDNPITFGSKHLEGDVCAQSGNGSVPGIELDYTLADTTKVVCGSLSFLLILPFVLFQIRKFPIGTTTAVLTGACLMVISNVLSQKGVYHLLGETENLRTIFLLLGMMILSQFFEREKMIGKILKLLLKEDHSFTNYVWRVNLVTFIFSALFTNDAACVVLTPIFLNYWTKQNRRQAELQTLLLAIATSSNIGSVTTIFGNPQMALIASRTDNPLYRESTLTLVRSLIYLGIPAIIAFFINWGFLILHYRVRDRLKVKKYGASGVKPKKAKKNVQLDLNYIEVSRDQEMENPAYSYSQSHSRPFKIILIIVIVLVITLMFIKVGDVSFDIATICLVVDAAMNKRNASVIMGRVDWGVIMMFFGIFVWLHGINTTRIPRWIWKQMGLANADMNDTGTIVILCVFVIFCSNIFSNVPLTIIVLDQLEPCTNQFALVLYLGWCSTIAGNLTLFGSVANLLVAQKAKETLDEPLTFMGYLKYGFCTTMLIVVIGIPIIYALLLI
ncbi:hypothetical protein LOTGIDRAFT_224982 [Lottia gigantea]|uniref:Citrate transporter-like domain-containing protein n=1 Tax=Lottia gigantea TaxID=225164 RepID=V4B8S6_LOTGI|nr:hypothetical protein LOTGIDRAFT_224982 [Lottia gigantea]ESP02242.1 hypothetical protein LOTGIDRAFT_224982 [Lottia gigantea]